MIKYKKTAYSITAVLVILGIIGGILYFLPNEVIFKIYNVKAVFALEDNQKQDFFSKAKKSFSKWSIIADNNLYGVLYEQKKYKELEKLLKEKINKECSIEQEKISQYCENIFYLNGLVQYRLGEDKDKSSKTTYFQSAIDSFQKTLAMNSENIWAEENIDFILQKNKDDAEEQKGEAGSGQEGDGEKQKGEEGEGSQQKQNGQSEEGEEQGREGQVGEGDEDGVGESRLPQNMQDVLNQDQKELEQDQGQEGFNRSQSAAQKNNYQNQDSFDQMMQQFLGGNINVNAQTGEANFTQEIENPNEKDW